MGRRTATTPDRTKQRFLAELARGRTISDAARAAGIGRRTAYDLRQRDEDFAVAWADAIEEGTDVYEEEARRRAIDGVPRPLLFRGQQVGEVREYSDRLLELMLKARRPDVYRERVALDTTARVSVASKADAALREAVAADPELAARIEALAARVVRADEDSS